MAQYEVDPEDAAAVGLFGLSAAVSVGIAEVNLFETALSDVLWASGSFEVTWAAAMSLVLFGFVVLTNQVKTDDVKDLPDEYMYAVAITVILLVTIPFVPQVHDWVTSNDIFALGAFLVQGAGVLAVGWLA